MAAPMAGIIHIHIQVLLAPDEEKMPQGSHREWQNAKTGGYEMAGFPQADVRHRAMQR